MSDAATAAAAAAASVPFEVPVDIAYTFWAVIVFYFTNLFLGGRVGAARKKYDVPVPQMYAAPDHKHAKEFNAVQRGHQNMIETSAEFLALVLLVGLFRPFPALIGAAVFCVGRVVYALGYSVRPGARIYGELVFFAGVFYLLYNLYGIAGEVALKAAA